jgi:hypothetical protein
MRPSLSTISQTLTSILYIANLPRMFFPSPQNQYIITEYITFCVSVCQFSVTVIKRRGLFGSQFRGSGHNWLAPLLWVCGKAARHGGECKVMVLTVKEKERKRVGSYNPLQEHSPSEINSFPRPCLLKLAPPCQAREPHRGLWETFLFFNFLSSTSPDVCMYALFSDAPTAPAGDKL